MTALPRVSIHQPPGTTNVAPSGVARFVSDESCSPAAVAAATFASAPWAHWTEIKSNNSSEKIHRVCIPKNLTIEEDPGKPFPPRNGMARHPPAVYSSRHL